MGTVWLIASGKGGVGKSTLASSLSVALNERSKSVCLVDMDFGLRGQDNLFGVQDRIIFDLLDVCEGTCELDAALIRPYASRGLCLLSAPQFARSKDLDGKAYRDLIARLAARFDHVIIDCPAGMEQGLRLSMKATVQETVVVVTPDDLCLRDAQQIISLMEKKHLPRPRLIVNRLFPDLVESGEMHSAKVCAQFLDVQLLGEMPDDSNVYRAQLSHLTVLDIDCPAAAAIRRIAGRMLQEDVPFPDFGKKRSWLSRFFRPGLAEMKRV
ncbi:MAG: P-loop NTPase [Clostridia bacterium]|nr:P-loop NTPase [Clostridia bacterium]